MQPDETTELDQHFAPPGEPQGDAPAPEVHAPAPPESEVTDDRIELYEGYKLGKDEARQLGEFYEWVKRYPDKAREFVGYLEDRYVLSPKEAGAGETTQEPPPTDQAGDDPSLKALRDELSTLRNEVETQRLITARSAVNRASSAFAEEHGLEKPEVEKILAEAYDMGIVPAMSARMAKEGRIDAVAAVHDALERTYWMLPDMRERAWQKREEELKTSQSRQRRQAGIGGTSGSVPRTTPEPQTPAERKAAMVEEIATAMRGTTE